MRKLRPLLVLSLLLIVCASFTHSAHAVTVSGLTVKCDTIPKPDKSGFKDPCTVDSFVQQFVILSQYALSLVAILGTLMMLYGGFQFLTAAGRASKIDEGKRILLGTIVGLIISFTAFVLVNFVIAAVTGSALAARNINPFGAIARVFVNPEDKSISRQFNSTGQVQTSNDCHSLDSGWDKDCATLQIHCADTSTTAGTVHNYQKVLTQAGCYPGIQPTDQSEVDGCFGPKTLDAVRRYQVANSLIPTGEIDSATKNFLDNPYVSANTCATAAATVDATEALLESPKDSTKSPLDTGCCIMQKGAVKTFCANSVTERTCDAQGGQFFAGNTSCATTNPTSQYCGYCHAQNGGCYQTTTQFWCDAFNDGSGAKMDFQAGRSCFGESMCSTCDSVLLLNQQP